MKNEKLMTILVSLAEECSRAAEKVRKGLGLTFSEYRGLICLPPEDKISCRDLSSRMKLSFSRSSRIIERLFEKGFIERADCASDRRRKNVWLTRKGAQARQDILSQLEDCEKRLSENIEEKRLTRLKSDLKDIAAKF